MSELDNRTRADKAKWVEIALAAYAAACGDQNEPPQTIVEDFLADLRHYAFEHHVAYYDADSTAQMHFITDNERETLTGDLVQQLIDSPKGIGACIRLDPDGMASVEVDGGEWSMAAPLVRRKQARKDVKALGGDVNAYAAQLRQYQ